MVLATAAAAASEAHLRVQLANRLALEHGVSIVRALLANKDGPLHGSVGMTTDEIYKLTLEQTPPPEFYNPHTKENKPFPPMPAPARKGRKKEQPPGPPNPEHPVRSKAFLKRTILQYLVGTQEIVKTRAGRTLDSSTILKNGKKGKRIPAYGKNVGKVNHTVWVWKAMEAVDPESIKKKPLPPKSPHLALFDKVPPRETVVTPEDVGVGEDISHLSKRRQKARRVEIRREVHMMKVQEGIRKQKERSAKGAELRRTQAERLAKKQKREEAAARKLELRKNKQEQESEDRKFAPRKFDSIREGRQEYESKDRKFAPRKFDSTRKEYESEDRKFAPRKFDSTKKSRQEYEWEDRRSAGRKFDSTKDRK